MNDSNYQIECDKSYEMVDIRRLIDDVMFQSAKEDGEINPQVAQLQSELEQKRDESLTHRLRDSKMNSQSVIEFEKEIFISYAWGGESEQFVNQLDQTLQAKGITIIRDKR
ncbi:MAG: toll/interleukin-1 receptor domain-containing protein, partial [Nostoc sp.]